MRGVFITFEGVEGSGKSTQARLLVEHLSGRGLDCVLTREPGGTAIGDKIRDILLDPENRRMDGYTELFLYLASRNQHVREKVMPALREGKVVISDRYAESSVAYQGGGRAIGFQPVSRLNRVATAALKPDLVIVVDVPVEVGRERKNGHALDRLERERVEFHERVRSSYLRLARRAPKRMKVLDGTKPADELQREVRQLAEEVLTRKGLLR